MRAKGEASKGRYLAHWERLKFLTHLPLSISLPLSPPLHELRDNFIRVQIPAVNSSCLLISKVSFFNTWNAQNICFLLRAESVFYYNFFLCSLEDLMSVVDLLDLIACDMWLFKSHHYLLHFIYWYTIFNSVISCDKLSIMDILRFL